MSATEGLAQVNQLATHTANTLWANTSAFLALLVVIGILFFFAWYFGKGPFMALLLSFYAAYAIYITFPYASLLPTAPLSTALYTHVGLFLALTAVFFLILRRVVVSDFLYIGLFGMIALSFFGAAFLMALAFHVFPVTKLYHFSPAIEMLFGPDQYFFWWFVAPAIGLFFLAH